MTATTHNSLYPTLARRIATETWRTFVVLMLSLLAASCSKDAPNRRSRGPGEAAIPVTAAPAVVQPVPMEISTFGTVEPDASVNLKSQVDGIITKVHFQKGQQVRKGDLLFTIDPRPFQAALAQAEANLARDTVLADNAQKDSQRAEALFQKGISSEEELDKARASAASLAATVRADAALVNRAKLDLEHCSITSPIDGRIGNVLSDEGNLVKANDIPLAVVNRIRPVQVFFSIPQNDLPELKKYHAMSPLTVRAYPNNDRRDPELGRLVFIDNAIDPATGTVRLGAVFDNAQERLWPGQYVEVDLTLSMRNDAIVVPSAAVETGRDGKYVFVVRADGTAEVRPVTVAMTAGRLCVIDSGLSAGERVVTSGQFRLSPGARVEVKPESTGGADTAAETAATSRAAL